MSKLKTKQKQGILRILRWASTRRFFSFYLPKLNLSVWKKIKWGPRSFFESQQNNIHIKTNMISWEQQVDYSITSLHCFFTITMTKICWRDIILYSNSYFLMTKNFSKLIITIRGVQIQIHDWFFLFIPKSESIQFF